MKVRIAWTETAYSEKTVDMTREEFLAWDKSFGKGPRPISSALDDMFVAYKLDSVEPHDFDDRDLTHFGEVES